MERIVFSWDYTDWPLFSSRSGDDPYPDIRARISSGLAEQLTEWARDMGSAYADETGQSPPSTFEADALDARFDALAGRLRSEGLDVEQANRWWREQT